MTRRTEYSYDHSLDRLYIRHTEDVEPVVDEVRDDVNYLDNGFSRSRNWRKIGSIPMMVVEQVLREKGINLLENSPEARKEARKILNEYNKFRSVDKPV